MKHWVVTMKEALVKEVDLLKDTFYLLMPYRTDEIRTPISRAPRVRSRVDIPEHDTHNTVCKASI
jgi:hypothetical protein